MTYTVYVVRRSDNTLYTSITKDIKERILEHYTFEKGASASKCEYQIKK